MRVLNIFIVLIIFTNLSFSQDQVKRNVYSLGGTMYYYSSTDQYGTATSDQTAVDLVPSLSYFFLDQFEVLLNFEYLHETTKETNPAYFSSSEMKYTVLGFGIGFRYYIPLGKYAPFIGASGGTRWTSAWSEPFSTPSTNFILTGGVEIFISNSAAIEPAVSYTKYRLDENDSRKGFQVGIGVKYFIY